MSAIVHLVIVAGIGLMFCQDNKLEALQETLVPIEVELGEYSMSDDLADTPIQAAAASPSNRPERSTDSRLTPEPAAVLAEAASASDQSNAVAEETALKEKATLAGDGNGTATTMAGQYVSGSNGNGAPGSSSSGRSGHLPYVIDGPPPSYPEEARVRGWEGTVRIRVLILEKGIVGDMIIVQSSGYGSMDQSAVNALRRWRFSPAYQGGRPVSAWVVVPVVFQLE